MGELVDCTRWDFIVRARIEIFVLIENLELHFALDSALHPVVFAFEGIVIVIERYDQLVNQEILLYMSISEGCWPT